MTWKKLNKTGLVVYESPHVIIVAFISTFRKMGRSVTDGPDFFGKMTVTSKIPCSKEVQPILSMMMPEDAIQQEFDANLLGKLCRVLPSHQKLIDIG